MTLATHHRIRNKALTDSLNNTIYRIECYSNTPVVMGDVAVKFDPKPDKVNRENCKIALKARSENIVKLSTKSLGH